MQPKRCGVSSPCEADAPRYTPKSPRCRWTTGLPHYSGRGAGQSATLLELPRHTPEAKRPVGSMTGARSRSREHVLLWTHCHELSGVLWSEVGRPRLRNSGPSPRLDPKPLPTARPGIPRRAPGPLRRLLTNQVPSVPFCRIVRPANARIAGRPGGGGYVVSGRGEPTTIPRAPGIRIRASGVRRPGVGGYRMPAAAKTAVTV